MKSTNYDTTGLYLLTISIFQNVTKEQAELLFHFGPNHEICQHFLHRDIPAVSHMSRIDKCRYMTELQDKGYSIRELAELFDTSYRSVQRYLHEGRLQKTIDALFSE